MEEHKTKNKILLIILFLIWVIMLVKTIYATTHEPENYFSPFYGIMLNNTWQSLFNVDLFLFSILFASWAIYREKSPMIGIAVGVFSILLGGVFLFLYLNICAIEANGNFSLLLNGKKCKSEL